VGFLARTNRKAPGSGRTEQAALSWDPSRETTLAQHAETVRRFCRSRIQNEADAEDAAQDTFLRFLQCREEVRNSEAWLIHVAQRVCVDFHRRQGRQPTSPLERESQAVGGADPAEIVVEIHSAGELLDRLATPDRDLLEKLYLRGLSVTQVAALLKVSPGNVRIMAMRARRRASEAFAAMGESVGCFAPVQLLASIGPNLKGFIKRRLARHGGRAAGEKRSESAQMSSGWWTSVGQVLAPAAILAIALGPGPIPHAAAKAGGDPAPAPGTASPSGVTVQGDGSMRAAEPGSLSAGRGAGGPASASAPGWRGPGDPSALVGSVVAPGANAKPEDASFAWLTASPSYGNDRTVFASGTLIYGCLSTCSTVFVTRDAGKSWMHLASVGFGGGRVLLSPMYPSDPTLFAVGALGLQRSDDGGASWSVAVPAVSAAAVAADSQAGNARVLVGGQVLMWYLSGNKQLSAGPTLPLNMSSVYELTFGRAGRSVIVAGQQTGSGMVGPNGMTVARCEGDHCVSTVTVPNMDAVHIARSPTMDLDGAAIVYSSTTLAMSSDDGATFRTQAVPGANRVISLSLDPDYAHTHSLLAGTLNPTKGSPPSAIARSVDGGGSFALLPVRGLGATLQISEVLILPDGHVLAALTVADPAGDLGIRCSIDGGVSWDRGC
jgi:RNA polymerase sigma-70 factor (ECF subfamily)